MKLHSITLDKIGAYHFQTFDLVSEDPHKNVILVGGKNGSGKTTFLQAIKLGLFGCYAYGYKSNNADYLRKVWTYLNSRERDIEGRRFWIELKFSETENYQEHMYTFHRMWTISKGNLKEKFSIIKDGRHLSESEMEKYQSKLRETMPPHLFELCLFNGEEIRLILTEKRLASYLEELSGSLFHLDLFKTLESDLQTYADWKAHRTQLSDQEQKLHELISQKREREEFFNSLKQKEQKLVKKRDKLEQQYAEARRIFDSHGGVLREEINQVNEKVQAIEAERRANDEAVKDFISKILPFCFNRKLLSATRKQMELESEGLAFEQIRYRLNNGIFKRIIKNLSGFGEDNNLHITLKNEIIRELDPGMEQPYIHRASFREMGQVEEIYNRLQEEDLEYYVSKVEDNLKLLTEVQELRNTLKRNNDNEFSNLLRELEALQLAIVDIKKQQESLEEQLEETMVQIKDWEIAIERLKNEMLQSTKVASTYQISHQVIRLSQSFRELQLKKNLQQVQLETQRMLNKLLRKDRYIAFVSIDPKNYEVKLKDTLGEDIAKETLSAGEQQLLILSLIWAMFRCSGHRFPFIFDTLLGRLDREHKNRVMQELVPTIGDQVIVLSTDSEIDEENYQKVQPYIAREYSLNFNTEEKQIEVMPHYFHFGEVQTS